MKYILDFSDFSSINEDLSEYTPKLISLINTKNSRIGLVTGHQNMENTHLLLMMMVIPS